MESMKLFDLNGDVGRGAVESTAFDDASALLAHMDYLGIERSLVTHVEGRELNPTVGNRVLLRELERTPAAADRLFPVLTINPASFYERGAMSELRGQLESGAARALAAFPATCRHPLSHLEPVLAELARFRPALLWSTRENPGGEADYHDLVSLAGRFPQITFVCLKKMWGGFGSVLDAMRRCTNVSLDISWLHMRRAIELVVRAFGAERVLFGTGCRTHEGAAIAALAHADIEERDRRLIASGNLERLLGLEPCTRTIAGGRRDKPFWDALRQGRAVGAEIIDAHGHIGASNRGWYLPESDIAETARDTSRHMERLGIGRVIVSAEGALFADALEGNREAERELAPFRDRFSGYVAFNPRFRDRLEPELDRLFGSDFFVGFKFLPSYWKIRVDDPSYLPAARYAHAHRLPILCHTWNDQWDSPSMLASMARDHPEATFLLGHSGGGTAGRVEAIELARAYPNVYLEFCGSFTSDYPWPKTFEQVGFDRVVFGSDGGGAHDQAWELGHLLSQPVADRELEPVLAGTMKAILARRR
jgi:uncharacterized protein